MNISTSQQIHTLQSEERRLILALSSIRTQLNAFTAISALPTEILIEVFSLCAWEWLYDSPHGRKHPHRLAWTQVCRTWRDVALNTPRLWSHIDVCDVKLARECLLRSAEVPIHIASTPGLWNFPPATPPEDDPLVSLNSHAHRVQSISTLLFPEDLSHLFDFLGPSLPSLTSLTLRVPPVSSNFVLEGLPTSLPSLRKLRLGSVSVPWDMLCHHTFTSGSTCAGLTHLELSGLVSGEAPTLHQLLEIFRASQCLEEIRLEHVVPTAPSPSPSPSSSSTPPPSANEYDIHSGFCAGSGCGHVCTEAHIHTRIPLPSLRTLHITSKPPKLQIHAILAHLSLPPAARTVLECWSLDFSDSGSGSTSTPGSEFGPLGLGLGIWAGFFPTPLRALYPDVLGVERVEIGELDSDVSTSPSTSKSTSTPLQTPLISIQTHHRLSTQSTPTLIHTILPIFFFLHGHGHDYDTHHYYTNADADAIAGRDTAGDGDGEMELGILANLHPPGPVVYVDDGVPHARALREELCEYFGSRVAMA
ncbi:hypothetical protein H0H92_004379 [Tricholoma furcatifolium]|nr:hypothetical protein H0H92_004379 [Tricholoma furcatifolium]